jgi:heme exporter protein A
VRSERTLFAGLDFSVGAGEVLQVRGANGAGKSSLLRILCGLAQPDAGEVRWGGSSIAALGPQFAGQLIYVGHGNALKLDLDARENLKFLRELRVRDGARSTDAILEDCGLGACAGVPVSRLSAGQRRRLSLARLLLCTAPLWLLDEPFTSLDAAGRGYFTRLIAEHAADGGVVVIAGHEPITVRRPTKEVLLG